MTHSQIDQHTNPPTLPQPLARFENVTRRFRDITAVDGLQFDIQQGETVALLGPNEAGKTTATELLLGLGKPSPCSPAAVDCHAAGTLENQQEQGRQLQ